jgi:hypothetical protein
MSPAACSRPISGAADPKPRSPVMAENAQILLFLVYRDGKYQPYGKMLGEPGCEKS